MKRTFLLISVLVLSSIAQGVEHRWLCVDNGSNKLVHVDQTGKTKNWTIDIPGGSRDIQLLDKKKILVGHGNGAAEYDLATGKKLEWSVSKYKGIQTARRLKDGNTLLCTTRGQLIELDADGKEKGKTNIQVKGLNIRLIRILDCGNILIGGAGPKAIIEVSRDGKLVRQLKLPGKGYKAIKLKNGNYAGGTGDDVRIVTMDKDGKIVSYVGGKKDHPDAKLSFCSGWDLLPNGNMVMANWLGHGQEGKGPHLVEFTPDNKIIWQWTDHKAAKRVTNVLMLK